MQRSFTDRVLGGVCGGMAASLPVNAWILRTFFIILAPVSLGVGALAYIALWWLLPMESLISPGGTRFVNTLIVGLVLIAFFGAWLMSQFAELPSDLSLPVVVFALISAVFLIRQLGGR